MKAVERLNSPGGAQSFKPRRTNDDAKKRYRRSGAMICWAAIRESSRSDSSFQTPKHRSRSVAAQPRHATSKTTRSGAT
jgi:hypothetical protein